MASKHSSVTSYLILFVTIIASSTATQLNGMESCLPGISSWTVGNGSSVAYNPSNGTWTFHMNLTVPKKDETKDVMHFRIKLNLVSEEDWRFAQNLTTRIHRTDAFHLLNESRQVNVSAEFDHAYSGNYTLIIESCSTAGDVPYSCWDSAVVVLCRVETHLKTFDVTKMNISISTSPTEQGINVEFMVDYKNKTENFLPFREFVVELNSADRTRSLKSRTKWNRVEFRNCSYDSILSCTDDQQRTICCGYLPSGNYTTAINPVDSRCNIAMLDSELNVIPATQSAKTRTCRRFSAWTPFEIAAYSTRTVAAVVTNEAAGAVWIIPTVIGIIVLALLIAFVYYRRHRRRVVDVVRPNPNLTDDAMIPLADITAQQQAVLLVYTMGDPGMKQKASLLRQRLLAGGVAMVWDCGDECQDEEISTVGIQNWFLERIHDPAVKILVIHSPEMMSKKKTDAAQLDHHSQLFLYLLDQLMAVSISDQRRIFILTYKDSDVSPDQDVWLNPFIRYRIPDDYEPLLDQLLREGQQR